MQGRLDLDRPLAAYLDNFESTEEPRLTAVTLRQVLSHTSGFPTANLKKGDTLKLEFDPGSRFAYSGESYRYLGQILEHITGSHLSTYMKTRFSTLKNG